MRRVALLLVLLALLGSCGDNDEDTVSDAIDNVAEDVQASGGDLSWWIRHSDEVANLAGMNMQLVPSPGSGPCSCPRRRLQAPRRHHQQT